MVHHMDNMQCLRNMVHHHQCILYLFKLRTIILIMLLSLFLLLSNLALHNIRINFKTVSHSMAHRRIKQVLPSGRVLLSTISTSIIVVAAVVEVVMVVTEVVMKLH